MDNVEPYKISIDRVNKTVTFISIDDVELSPIEQVTVPIDDIINLADFLFNEV